MRKIEEKNLSGLPESGITDKKNTDTNDENTAIRITGVDTEKGLSLYGGEMDIYLPLLHSYVSNTPGNLNKLSSVSKETLPEYVITVHGLKGTSASVGAETIREAALKLEMMGRAGDLNGILANNGKLIKDTEIIVANIKTWLEKNDTLTVKPILQAPSHEVLAKLLQSCEECNMNDIDKAMSELESADYEQDAGLIKWVREKINFSEIAAITQRLSEYMEKSGK